MDVKTLRLADLQDHDTIVAVCQCSHMVEFRDHRLTRELGLPGDLLLVDLPGRLRCKQCGAKERVRITIFDERTRYTLNPSERIVVAGWGRFSAP
jgi:hypothetical protein